MLTDHLSRGDGLAAHGFISELASRGHEIHVAVEESDLIHEYPPNVTLHHIGRPRTARRLTYAVKLRKLFKRLSRSVDFDVMHQLNPVDAGLTLLLPSTAPLVLGPYMPQWGSDLEPGRASRNGWRRWMADFLRRVVEMLQQRRASVLLLTTPAARSAIRRSKAETQILPFGIDTERFAPSDSDRGLTDPQARILYLANVAAHKGIDVLIDAFEELSQDRRDAELIVAGGGGYLSTVMERVEASPIRDSVKFLGNVPRDEVPSVMGDCDVYCLPSFGEPFGLSALEAMACGKPVIGTRAGGLQFLVDARGGWLVTPGDSSELAQTLDESLNDLDQLQSMGRFNRERVENEFSWSAVGDRLEEIYARACIEPDRVGLTT